MRSFRWGQEFVTGIDEVDEQHQGLVSLINNLGEQIALNIKNDDALSWMFGRLTTYTLEHFKEEERVMTAARVDRRHADVHIKQHTDFIQDVQDMIHSLQMEDTEDWQMLLEYLIHWLAFHILGTDQNMAQQVLEIELGANPAEAYDKCEKEIHCSVRPLVVALTGLFSIVSKRNKALQELNASLDAKVAERTNELTKANEALEKISLTDYLTRLPNRRFALRKLRRLFKESVENGRPVSCMMIDADGFKEVNDNFGHDAGDAVLKRLSLKLKHSVRSDDIIARLGGDEFLVICPDTDMTGAMYVGEMLRKNISSLEVDTGEAVWKGSVSIGVATTTPEMDKMETLLKIADKGVYQAKRDGRNCVRSIQPQEF